MQNIYKALLSAQAEFPSIEKDSKNPHFRNAYSSLPNILSKVLPVLRKHGVLFSSTINTAVDQELINIKLIHAESGECIESNFRLSNTLDPQKVGSCITYYQRYGLLALLGISADLDDDGNQASEVNVKPNPLPGRAVSLVADENTLAQIINLAKLKSKALDTLDQNYRNEMRTKMEEKTLTKKEAEQFLTKLKGL